MKIRLKKKNNLACINLIGCSSADEKKSSIPD